MDENKTPACQQKTKFPYVRDKLWGKKKRSTSVHNGMYLPPCSGKTLIPSECVRMLKISSGMCFPPRPALRDFLAAFSVKQKLLCIAVFFLSLV